MRFVTPSVFFGTALLLWIHNGRSGEDILALSFIPTFWPEAAGDPQKLSQGTVGLLTAMGLFFFARDLTLWAKARRHSATPD